MDVHVPRRLVAGAALLLLAGCAGQRPSPSSDAGTTDVIGDVEAAGVTFLAWFADRPGGPAELPTTSPLLAAAAADTVHVWLWARLALPVKRHVRIAGPGSLRAVFPGPAGYSCVDAGICVALDSDANVYLNSSTGPITIRASHARGARGGVPLLIRMPAAVAGRGAAPELVPVDGRWTCLH